MVSTFTALFDACVLYPAPLRDLLMRLAMTGLFRARWTNEIHNEWIKAVLANRKDIQPSALERTKALMNSHVRDSVVTGYESLIPSLALPDPNDRHVLAAAIRTRAHVIVTFNLKDYPKSCLDKFGIEAQHPDEFIHHLFGIDLPTVCAAAKKQREALKHPPKTTDEFLACLARQGLPKTVHQLDECRELI